AASPAPQTELLHLAAKRWLHYWKSWQKCQPPRKMFRTFLNGFSLFLLFQTPVGKNDRGRLLPLGQVVPVCMRAVISTFPKGRQSTPLPTAWSLAGRMHFTAKLLPWRLTMDLSLLVTERSK